MSDAFCSLLASDGIWMFVFGVACLSLWCRLMIRGSHTCSKCEIEECVLSFVSFAHFSFWCLLMVHCSHTCNMHEIDECVTRLAYFSFWCFLMLHDRLV